MPEAVRMVLGTLLSFLLFSQTKCLLLLLLGVGMSGKSREDTIIGLLDMDTKWDRLGEEYVRVQSPARKVLQNDKVFPRHLPAILTLLSLTSTLATNSLLAASAYLYSDKESSLAGSAYNIPTKNRSRLMRRL